ncbi:MAG TPA: hypothetical protein C5S51_06470 [Methanosarcinaceae archaeon]|nr:hypothetical protein [Methanosarcinaceae archaeon]
MEPEELFEFYRFTFLPAYSDYVGFTVTKPTQVLNELENTLAHVAQYHNPALDSKIKQQNIRKAYGHLQRSTLDLYKLLLVGMQSDLKSVHLDDNKRAFALNTPEEDFLKSYNSFRSHIQDARAIEIKNIGTEPLKAIELYKNCIVLGKELIDSIDYNKIKKLKKYKISNFIQQNMVAAVIGFFVGLFSNYVWINYLQ